LLTREEEVEISKRIEEASPRSNASFTVSDSPQRAHFRGRETHRRTAPERFDRVVLDKKVESRDSHLKSLCKHLKQVRDLDQKPTSSTPHCEPPRAHREKLLAEFEKCDRKLQASFAKFYYKQKVVEEMCLVARTPTTRFLQSQRALEEAAKRNGSAGPAQTQAERIAEFENSSGCPARPILRRAPI